MSLLDRYPILQRLYYLKPVYRIVQPIQRWRFERAQNRLSAPYGPVPKHGWGHQWCRLLFDFTDAEGGKLQLLAPLDRFKFDEDVLRHAVRNDEWPAYEFAPGIEVARLGWAGHHQFVEQQGGERHRLGLPPIIPGRYGGGTRRGLKLIAVQPTGIAIDASTPRIAWNPSPKD